MESHSVTIMIALLSLSINLISVSNNLFEPVGVRVPSVWSKELTSVPTGDVCSPIQLLLTVLPS